MDRPVIFSLALAIAIVWGFAAGLAIAHALTGHAAWQPLAR